MFSKVKKHACPHRTHSLSVGGAVRMEGYLLDRSCHRTKLEYSCGCVALQDSLVNLEGAACSLLPPLGQRLIIFRSQERDDLTDCSAMGSHCIRVQRRLEIGLA